MTRPAQRLLGERYSLGPTLGVGGMAEVFLGRDMRLGRDVAVKVLRADLARDPSFHSRFRREAQAVASLNAPCIVSVYDTSEDNVDGTRGVPWIVMEHVQGRTLREVLHSDGRLLPQRALEVVADVCAALQVAHQAGIVHRDVKPGNVMLTVAGEVKVMDFGIARAAASGSATMTQTANVIGTAAYLSPEQARGGQVDGRSDLYSTGCLLYELLTGRPPFTGDSPVAVAYQHVREQPLPPSTQGVALSPDVDAVVLQALAKSPDARYPGAEQMRDDLLRAAAGQPVQARLPASAPDGPAQRAPTPGLPVQRSAPVGTGSARAATAGPRRPALAVFALLLLAVLGAAAVLTYAWLPTTQRTVPQVVGLTQQQAAALLTDSGLSLRQVQPQFSTRPVGVVLKQSPAPGSRVGRGDPVSAVVSHGVQQVLVPPVVQRSGEEARAQLEQAGLVAGPPVQRDGNLPAGRVLDVLPGVGTVLPAGSTVTLVVATGLVEVPQVVRLTADLAEQRLQAAGFNVGVRLQADGGPPGVVLSQEPTGGRAVSGGAVIIVVSRAPR